MSDDWQQNGMQGGFYDLDRQEGNEMNTGHMASLPGFYGPPGYRGFNQNSMGVQSNTYPMIPEHTSMYGLNPSLAQNQPSAAGSFLPSGTYAPSSFRQPLPPMDQSGSFSYKMDPSTMDLGEEDFEEATRKIKKRKLNGAPVKAEKPKRSILEEMLIILDEGTHGIRWCIKVDTEGDVQDGMQIYNDAILEQTLEERRCVVGYGLSKHLAKDLRYYGFVYDRETKVFWNEDHKHGLTHRSYWQKDDRSKCLQLKRMTSEPERNLSRLSSLMKNVQLAELLKVPEHSAICPPPSKYIVLSEIHNIFPACLASDAHNIKVLLAHFATNETSRAQWEAGCVPTKAFDHLMTRLNTTATDFVADLREFVAGASKWYHGVMERDEAVSLLHGQPEGTFLIRESTQSDQYSLSWVKHDPMQQALLVNHMRIEQNNAGFAVHGDESPTRTLVQWIGTHAGNLKHPLPSQRYASLTVVQSSEKRPFLSEGNLPDNYLRGFPSRMDSSNPASPSQ